MKIWSKLIAIAAAGAGIYGIVRAVRHHRAVSIGQAPGDSLDHPIQTQADNPLAEDDLDVYEDPVIVTEEVVIIADVPVSGR